MAQNTHQRSGDRQMNKEEFPEKLTEEEYQTIGVMSSMLDELKEWFEEFCNEPMKNAPEEINSLYDWFEAHHKRQYSPNKDSVIL